MKNLDFRENAKKIKKKIKKFIAQKLMILETSGWRRLKEEKKLFLSYEFQKMYPPSQEMAQLSQIPQIKNGKPDFSPLFQKVELRNLTFFQ